MKKMTVYPEEKKQLIIKEAIESGDVPSVAEKFSIPPGTIYTWVAKQKNSPTRVINAKDQEIRRLKKQLEDEKLKNQIMAELLKKTYQIW